MTDDLVLSGAGAAPYSPRHVTARLTRDLASVPAHVLPDDVRADAMAGWLGHLRATYDMTGDVVGEGLPADQRRPSPPDALASEAPVAEWMRTPDGVAARGLAAWGLATRAAAIDVTVHPQYKRDRWQRTPPRFDHGATDATEAVAQVRAMSEAELSACSAQGGFLWGFCAHVARERTGPWWASTRVPPPVVVSLWHAAADALARWGALARAKLGPVDDASKGRGIWGPDALDVTRRAWTEVTGKDAPADLWPVVLASHRAYALLVEVVWLGMLPELDRADKLKAAALTGRDVDSFRALSAPCVVASPAPGEAIQRGPAGQVSFTFKLPPRLDYHPVTRQIDDMTRGIEGLSHAVFDKTIRFLAFEAARRYVSLGDDSNWRELRYPRGSLGLAEAMRASGFPVARSERAQLAPVLLALRTCEAPHVRFVADLTHHGRRGGFKLILGYAFDPERRHTTSKGDPDGRLYVVPPWPKTKQRGRAGTAALGAQWLISERMRDNVIEYRDRGILLDQPLAGVSRAQWPKLLSAWDGDWLVEISPGRWHLRGPGHALYLEAADIEERSRQLGKRSAAKKRGR